MDDNHRTILRKNRRKIVNSLENVKDVVDYLLETDPLVLTKNMKDQIYAEKIPADQVRKLLDILTYRGPTAFDEFYDSLVDSNNGHIADLLCPEKAEVRKQSSSSGRQPLPVQPTQPSQPTKPSSQTSSIATSSLSSNEDTNITVNMHPHIQQASQNEIDEEPDFEKMSYNYSPAAVSFNEVDGNVSDEMKEKLKDARNVYELNVSNPDEPVGQYLIITNKNVKGKKWAERENDQDITALQDLFEKLGFRPKTKSLKNLSAKDLRKSLIKFSRDLPVPTSSLIVFIHSYGTDGGFYCYDGEIFKFEELENIFTADECPALSEKPKLFFVQSCIPEEEDKAMGADYVEKIDIKADSGPIAVSKGKKADVYLYLSRTPGNLWAEQYQKGSWFVQAFVGILVQYSHRKGLSELMLLVKNYVEYLKDDENKNRNSSEEVEAKLQAATNSLDKEFYFSPFRKEDAS